MRTLLDQGFTSFNGKQWPACHIDDYNAIQVKINGFIAACLPVPEYLLSGSANLFKSYSGMWPEGSV